MKRPRFRVLGLAVALAIGGTGCGAQKITALQRKEAAHQASEAQFAMSLREWTRAEALLVKAVQACPDTPVYWVNLGSTRMRLGNRSGAKDAYRRALKGYETEAAKDKTAADPWLKQVYVLALLGRVADGRALLANVAKRFPANRDVRMFVEGKQLDRMIADPMFQQVAL